MMKKTALVTALALLGVVGAASVNAAAPQAPAPQQMTTDAVMVNFQGKVAASTCNVTVGTGSNTLDLGRVAPKAKSNGALVPVTFGFSGCSSSKMVKTVKFEGGQNGGVGGGDDTTRGVLGTNNKNVFVQLFNKQDMTGSFTDTVKIDQQVGTGTDKVTATPFFARLEVGGFDATAGDITSVARFTVSYQ